MKILRDYQPTQLVTTPLAVPREGVGVNPASPRQQPSIGMVRGTQSTMGPKIASGGGTGGEAVGAFVKIITVEDDIFLQTGAVTSVDSVILIPQDDLLIGLVSAIPADGTELWLDFIGSTTLDGTGFPESNFSVTSVVVGNTNPGATNPVDGDGSGHLGFYLGQWLGGAFTPSLARGGNLTVVWGTGTGFLVYLDSVLIT